MNPIIKRIKLALNSSDRIVRDISKMQRAYSKNNKVRYLFYCDAIYRRYGCCISPRATIAPDVVFPHPVGIVIGDGSVVESGCVIYQGVTLGRKNRDAEGYPILQQGCIAYAGASILGSVKLAPGTVIAAGAVVTKGTDIENDILVGIPAHSKHVDIV